MVRSPTSQLAAALVGLPGGTADDVEDAALARALIAGQPGAAQATWARFFAMVHGALARTLGRDDDLSDLTQEVFLRVFQRIHTLRDHAALRSFVYSIAVRVIRAELRRRWVRRIVRPFDEPDEVEAFVAAPSASPEARDALRRLYVALDRLGARERTAYVLRHIEGMNLEETAAAMSVSLATIKRILARAGSTMDVAMRADPVLAGYFNEKSAGQVQRGT